MGRRRRKLPWDEECERRKRLPAIGDKIRLCYSTPNGAFLSLGVYTITKLCDDGAIRVDHTLYLRRSWVLLERNGISYPASRNLALTR